ncbi:MAG: integrase/recombinase XerD [Chthoniobacter sp.]|jgi:site-specific recombinase XerD|nr:integrase/recombinase XerD [Chthoniobacter sp.]
MSRDVVVLPERSRILANTVPPMVSGAGPAAEFAYEEFIFGAISNSHTKEAYGRAVREFLKFTEFQYGCTLATISPRMVREYISGCNGGIAKRKQHLSALRHFFDICVTRHAVPLNPALSVRGDRYSQVEGKTPDIGKADCRKLLASIDTSTLIGKRDVAIISVLIYTAARVGAVAALTCDDFYHAGNQWMLHFVEKGGKSREIPVRHDLQLILSDYVTTGGLDTAARNAPLFSSICRAEGVLSGRSLTRIDIARILKRRLRKAELSSRLSAHSFRVTTITDLLEQDIPLEDVQQLAGHCDPRTTRLYDRRRRTITRNIVERISV